MVSLRNARAGARETPLTSTIVRNRYLVTTGIFGGVVDPRIGHIGISDFRCDHWGGLWVRTFHEPFTAGGLAEAHADVAARLERGELTVLPECAHCKGDWESAERLGAAEGQMPLWQG